VHSSQIGDRARLHHAARFPALTFGRRPPDVDFYVCSVAGVPLFVAREDRTNLDAGIVCEPVDLELRARARRAIDALGRVIG